MKWIVLWFALNSGAQLPGIPEKTFDTKAACEEFAYSRVRMIEMWKGQPVRYECQPTKGDRP